VFELSDLDGDGNLSRQEFERVATMLSPALGAAMHLGKIGTTSGAEDNRSDDQGNTAIPAAGLCHQTTTLGSKQARLRQLFDLYALDQNGQLGMDSLVVLIETIHSAERALTADSIDEIRGGGSIAGASRAPAQREATLIGHFIFNHRQQATGTQAKQGSSIDACRNGQPTSSSSNIRIVLTFLLASLY
jgi:Ca2+-binding EF-hand superfamily protein